MTNVSFALVAASTLACRTVAPTSAVKVTNGIATNDISAVTCLNVGFGCCTGSFVNATTMLTAAHCLGHQSANEYTLSVNGTAPIAKHYYPSAFPNPWLSNGQDVAILKFPASVSQSLGITNFLTISQTAPNAGDPVTLIGYGKTDHADDSSAGSKHYGTNTISSTDDSHIYLQGVTGPTGTPGTNAALDSGDSGGPLLNAAGEIIGVASTSGPVDGQMQTHYVRVPNGNMQLLLTNFLGESPNNQNQTDPGVVLTAGTYAQNGNPQFACSTSQSDAGISMNCGSGNAVYSSCQNNLCYFNGDTTSAYRIRVDSTTSLTVFTPNGSFGFALQN